LQRGPARQRAVHIGVLDHAAAAQEFLTTLPGVGEVVVQSEQNHLSHTRLEVKFSGDDAALSAMLRDPPHAAYRSCISAKTAGTWKLFSCN
jgi:hypothetical protein